MFSRSYSLLSKSRFSSARRCPRITEKKKTKVSIISQESQLLFKDLAKQTTGRHKAEASSIDWSTGGLIITIYEQIFRFFSPPLL